MKINNPTLVESRALIGGQWTASGQNDWYEVLDPATGEALCEVANCGSIETAEAIEAAEDALVGWKKRSASDKACFLRRWAELMVQNREDLARIITYEQGKPLAEARAEIDYGAGYFFWFAEEAPRIYGDLIPSPSNDKRIVCLKQPVGVVACITPWNFPNAMLARKLAPALAAGCTIICKPANETPLSANALAMLAQQADLPRGVINIISGKTAEIGEELTSNPIVRKLSFTGSTPVGKSLIEKCAGTVKRTSMELGGNAPFIVFDDADLDAAIKGLVINKFRNAGQTCICANRIFVHDGIYDTFAKKLTEAIAIMHTGNGFDPQTTIGPVINSNAARKIRSIIEDASVKGGKIFVGSHERSLGENFVSPVVITEATIEMRAFKEEIFGPVAPLLRFSSEDEVLRLANDTEYGLASYFYTRDVGRLWRLGEALEYGIVGANDAAVSNPAAPFGGVKQSGQGREGSKYGLDDYLEIKYLSLGGLS